MGLTTNVSENDSAVQACVNITQGYVNTSHNHDIVFAYISTSESTGFNSAVGKTMTTILYLRNHNIGTAKCRRPDYNIILKEDIFISGIVLPHPYIGCSSNHLSRSLGL